MYQHIFMESINRLNKNSGKLDNQQQYKSIIEAAMVSTSEWFYVNSPMSPSHSVIVKKSTAIKSIPWFPEAFDINHKTDVLRLCAAKWDIKEIIVGSMLWSVISNRRGQTKIK